MSVVLPLLVLLPVATSLLLLLFRSTTGPRTARAIALCGAVATLLLALGVAGMYRPLGNLPVPMSHPDDTWAADGPVRPRVHLVHEWLTYAAPGDESGDRAISLRFEFGLDGISVALMVLTAVLTVSAVLISWESIHDRESEFYACLLILETGLLGVFCAFDLLLFYVFFEFTLIPLFFLIGIWGGPRRKYAAIKFFLYTLAGGLVTVVGLVAIVLTAASQGLTRPFSIPYLADFFQTHPLAASTQAGLFLALSAGFMVKVPLFPFHTWLPLAHVEAPTAGSVILAGVLLKLGTYGFLRLCLPLLPAACVSVGLPLISVLSIIGIVYGSLCALAQRDIKKLVAYSSIAHLGFCMLGLFALNVEGISGAVLQMVNHGLSTGALFLLVGMVYERYHTRQLDDLGGLAQRLPLITCGMVFITMSSIGLPGLNGFVGEMLSLIGMFKRHPLYAVLGATGIVLGAWYMLTMVQQAFFGPLKEPQAEHGAAPHAPVGDMTAREFLALAPLAVLCVWIGILPQPLLELIEPDVASVARLYADQPEEAIVATGTEDIRGARLELAGGARNSGASFAALRPAPATPTVVLHVLNTVPATGGETAALATSP